jgi:hypothetical protein
VAVSAGDTPSATTLNDPSGMCVAYGERTTTSTGSTGTEVGVLRIDSIPIVSGRHYKFVLSPVSFTSTVAGDLIAVRFRLNTSGTATTASTLVAELAEDAKTASAQEKVHGMVVPYPATTTANLSLLLSIIRNTGTGTCTIAVSAAGYNIRVGVYDCGVDPGDTGVDL